jgi:hypothetical protein
MKLYGVDDEIILSGCEILLLLQSEMQLIR